MTPDERELRRALNARSGDPTPAFRARLSTALAEGRPAGDGKQAIALVAAILLAVGTVAVFLLLRHGPGLAPAQRPQTWQQRPLPSECQAEVATIWHTIDAGASWQRMDTQGIADAQCKSGLSFVDPAHGFLVASDPNY